ncbi:MAG: acetyl-CoA carboxylase biotin carboxyl carrier protein subunit [Clostridia bacterium]|nr:acetyl-CoA carboxylase biotin carboxyl carrier protein subunit [Clostridia bacterium]
MRTFQVTVNGQTYEVSVEEVSQDGATRAQMPAAPAPAAAPAKKAAAPKAAASGKSGSVQIKAPMPGNILDVKVKVGDQVRNGQPVCVLEAMKMENEIPAPQDGKVASVEVSKGTTVETGAVLVTLE